MSSANINDAVALQALLDQLKSSEAWQKVANSDATSVATDSPGQTSHETVNASSGTASTAAQARTSVRPYGSPQLGADGPQTLCCEESCNTPSVAALLSQLQSSNTLNAVAGSSPSRTHVPQEALSVLSSSEGGRTFGPGAVGPSNDTLPRVPHTPRQDLRACTFQQALPHLARVSEDRNFLKALTAMRTEQAELERQLFRERQEIQRKHEERVKTARTKANIIGAGLTRYEADALEDSFRADLVKFDRERVLFAWDSLVAKQQAALETLEVPTMFPSTQGSDRERQQKVMQVLGGIVGNEGSS